MPGFMRQMEQRGHDPNPFAMVGMMQNIMIPAILLSTVTIGVIIVFIVNVFRNPNVPKNRQVLWAILIGIVGTYAMPVYWYLYIWKEPVFDPFDNDPI